jgi:branched-subunit amino acid transport protein
MDGTRLQVILIMGLMAFAVRALPQLFCVGRKFPESWDRFLRYLSYAFICSIISTILFLSGARFQLEAAPYRAAALAVRLSSLIGPRARSKQCWPARSWYRYSHGFIRSVAFFSTVSHRTDQATVKKERHRRNQDHRQDQIAGAGDETRGDQRSRDARGVVQ